MAFAGAVARGALSLSVIYQYVASEMVHCFLASIFLMLRRLFSDAIARRYVCASQLQPDPPFLQELLDYRKQSHCRLISSPVHLVRKRLVTVGEQHWWVLPFNKPPNPKTCRPTVDKGKEVVATMVGDIHSYPLPRITCSQLTFFPLYQCQVNRLAHLAPFHYHS